MLWKSFSHGQKPTASNRFRSLRMESLEKRELLSAVSDGFSLLDGEGKLTGAGWLVYRVVENETAIRSTCIHVNGVQLGGDGGADMTRVFVAQGDALPGVTHTGEIVEDPGVLQTIRIEDSVDNDYNDLVVEISFEPLTLGPISPGTCEPCSCATGVNSSRSEYLTMPEDSGSVDIRVESVFPTRTTETDETADHGIYHAKTVAVCPHRIARPRVFIPVFPGTNCEYDTERAFLEAGAYVRTGIFRNLTDEDIRASADAFAKEIDQAQILMFPGGFSAGDEPDGSAKFFAAAFQNEKLKDAVERLLYERDGLALGVCNGFQALIKLGLLPEGHITGQNADAPTLTFNTLGRHISRMVSTKVVSNKSPWLLLAENGGVYVTPASHGEGRFVAPEASIRRLFENGQVATQYSDPDGRVTMDEAWNVNGSFAAIEGITSPDGRVFGKMAHIERRGKGVAINISGEQDMRVFRAGVKYFS